MDRKGMLVISGCPRNGTSANMTIQVAVHGEDAILGEKLIDRKEKREEALKKMRERQEDEEDAEHRVRMYLLDRSESEERKERMEHRQKRMEVMNPKGFWEMEFTVHGITPYVLGRGRPPLYSPKLQKVLDEVEDGAFKVCKVVSQGLLTSNPRMIGKIIYMIRHPMAVAKSQEKLSYNLELPDPETGEMKNISELITITTPKMFIEVTSQAAKFFIDNPEIPVRFYHFEDMVTKPEPMLQDMQDFVGVGDYSKAEGIIEPKLNRSGHAEVKSPLMEDAVYVYEKFSEAARIINETDDREAAKPFFEAIHKYLKDPRRKFNRERRKWPCFRANHMVNEIECRACLTDPTARENFKKDRDKAPMPNETPWQEEPCLFECWFDLDRKEYLTIEESIASNFWLSPGEEYTPTGQFIEDSDGNIFALMDPEE